MKEIKTIGFFCLVLLLRLNAQSVKGDLNVFTMRGENFKAGVITNLKCSEECLKVDKDGGYISFSLVGKAGERNLAVSCEVPLLKGTKKIKLDKDGDLGAHQKFTIEIFGKNPAVDKDIYEIQDEADEATINIIRIDEKSGEVEGTFSSKYMDSATGIRRLSANCHFLVKHN